jgi:hypothetical protein
MPLNKEASVGYLLTVLTGNMKTCFKSGVLTSITLFASSCLPFTDCLLVACILLVPDTMNRFMLCCVLQTCTCTANGGN